jgi:hypothetical protein
VDNQTITKDDIECALVAFKEHLVNCAQCLRNVAVMIMCSGATERGYCRKGDFFYRKLVELDRLTD